MEKCSIETCPNEARVALITGDAVCFSCYDAIMDMKEKMDENVPSMIMMLAEF
jgi:hypothetical protein